MGKSPTARTMPRNCRVVKSGRGTATTTASQGSCMACSTPASPAAVPAAPRPSAVRPSTKRRRAA